MVGLLKVRCIVGAPRQSRKNVLMLLGAHECILLGASTGLAWLTSVVSQSFCQL